MLSAFMSQDIWTAVNFSHDPFYLADMGVDCSCVSGRAAEDPPAEGHIPALHHLRQHEQYSVPRQVHAAAGAPGGRQDHPAECPLRPPAQEQQC